MIGVDRMIGIYVPRRWILVLFAHLGFVFLYSIRLNIATALNTTVNKTVSERVQSNHTIECKKAEGTEADLPTGSEFVWHQVVEQGYAPSPFFYGYLVSQIPAGLLTNRQGGKRIFGFGMLGTAFMALLASASAKLGLHVLAFSRFIDGVFEGVTLPAMAFLLAHWSPLPERCRMITVVYAGIPLGAVIAMPISASLTSYRGWAAAFYLFGALGVLYVPFWIYIVKDDPKLHSGLSEKEKSYIISSLPQKSTKLQRVSVPWKAMLTSPPVLAAACAYFCNTWTNVVILTALPAFFQRVLGLGAREGELMSMLPFVSAFLFTGLGGIVADYMRKRGISATSTRKIMTAAGFLGSMTFAIAASFAKCGQVAVSIFCLTMAAGILRLNISGFFMTIFDLSPRFSGLIMGISHSAGTLAGCFAAIATGILADSQPTRQQYQKVLAIAGGIALFGTAVTCFFGSGDLQSWNKMKVTTEKDDLESSDKEPLIKRKDTWTEAAIVNV